MVEQEEQQAKETQEILINGLVEQAERLDKVEIAVYLKDKLFSSQFKDDLRMAWAEYDQAKIDSSLSGMAM